MVSRVIEQCHIVRCIFWQASLELNSEGTAQTADIEGAKAKKSINTNNSNHLLKKIRFFSLDFDDIEKYTSEKVCAINQGSQIVNSIRSCLLGVIRTP